MDPTKVKGIRWFNFELIGDITFEFVIVVLDEFSKLSFEEKENNVFYYFQDEWKPIPWRDLREFLLVNY